MRLWKSLIKLRPLSNRVIVEQHAAEEETKGGIVIANNQEKPLKGTVVAVGPGRYLGEKFIETTVKPGDVVLFGKRAGEEVELDRDTTVIVLHEHEILAQLDV
jgi:chaperonin GroES